MDPVADHPVPALRGIEPAHRMASGAAGLAEPCVAHQRVGEVRAVRRMGALIFDQFALESEGGAVGEFSVRPEDVALIFVERVDGVPIAREIPLDERGMITRPWPGGFFEEGFREIFA